MGTVTSPAGSVKGNSLAGLTDAYTGNWSGFLSPINGNRAQWQHVVMLSSVTGACERKGSGGDYASGELTLRLTMVGYADLPADAHTMPPAAHLPLAFSPGVWITTSDGEHRVCKPYFMKASRNGGLGTDVAATSGAVIFTEMDAAGYAGSYDLWFGADRATADRATGSFTAPWCGTVPG